MKGELLEKAKRSYIIIASLTHRCYLYADVKQEIVKLVIPQGSILIERGDLVHAGSDYCRMGHKSNNLRLHWYLDCKDNGRKDNTTYLITDGENACPYFADVSEESLAEIKRLRIEYARENSHILKRAREKKEEKAKNRKKSKLYKYIFIYKNYSFNIIIFPNG